MSIYSRLLILMRATKKIKNLNCRFFLGFFNASIKKKKRKNETCKLGLILRNIRYSRCLLLTLILVSLYN